MLVFGLLLGARFGVAAKAPTPKQTKVGSDPTGLNPNLTIDGSESRQTDGSKEVEETKGQSMESLGQISATDVYIHSNRALPTPGPDAGPLWITRVHKSTAPTGDSTKTSGETEVIDAMAGAKAGALKTGTTNVSYVIGGVAGGLAVVGVTGLLVSRLVKRPKPQSEGEEAPKRFLPEPLLDEIEVDNPATAANGGLELATDDN
jgi:hypothetical protein